MHNQHRPSPRFASLASAALALVWWALPAAPASAQEARASGQWAVLIGVQKHDEKRLNLRFTNNDVRAVRKILIERAGLPPAELRKALKDCPARLKFLVLDCCHAGSDRAADEAGLEAERLARAVGVKEVPGCVVLASCRADEKSWEWPARGHGAFTYWLC